MIKYHYDAFGNTNANATTTGDATDQAQAAQPFRYQSKYFHAPSGLVDFGFRFYSPSLGRWINRDPIGEAGGINLYGYVGNDPVNSFDPYGLDALDSAANFFAGAGDALTLGGTNYIRTRMGTNVVVHKNTGEYIGGFVNGAIVGAGITAGAYTGTLGAAAAVRGPQIASAARTVVSVSVTTYANPIGKGAVDGGIGGGAKAAGEGKSLKESVVDTALGAAVGVVVASKGGGPVIRAGAGFAAGKIKDRFFLENNKSCPAR